MSEKAVRERKSGLKADYRGATPKQVAMAVLRYRPPAKQGATPKSRKGQRTENTASTSHTLPG